MPYSTQWGVLFEFFPCLQHSSILRNNTYKLLFYRFIGFYFVDKSVEISNLSLLKDIVELAELALIVS
jgi:hypothetical protein